ncbi:MAG TPA: STAS/SEC14 domain-containing protein [Thermoguttaceae bacterium]|nr:STAS/SEC14 domain-containing protein [Thermoguttaceae bacterium]
MKSHWIEYQGKQLLYCDYTGFGLRNFEAFKTELDGVMALVTQEPEGSVLALADVRRIVASPAVVAAFKKVAIASAKHVRKQAVVGVTGVKRILYDAVMRVSKQTARAFGDSELEEAKKWLVEED